MYEYVFSYYPKKFRIVPGLGGIPVIHAETVTVMADNDEEAAIAAKRIMRGIRAMEAAYDE